MVWVWCQLQHENANDWQDAADIVAADLKTPSKVQLNMQVEIPQLENQELMKIIRSLSSRNNIFKSEKNNLLKKSWTKERATHELIQKYGQGRSIQDLLLQARSIKKM